MANQEHLDILKQDIGMWNQWREDDREVKIDLSEANLSRAQLAEANLRGADLSEAVLSGVNLRRADLEVANLIGADLSEADLSEANLRRADLDGSNLCEANLHRAKLRQAHLRRANLSRANLIGAHLAEADLSYANLSDAHLIRAELSGADLLEAELAETNLRRSDLRGADLRRAKLRQADLRNADLRNANLSGADLSSADLSSADLRGTNLTRTNLRASQMGGTIFGENDLSSTLGLQEIEHLSSSTMGADTIRRSKGKIPIEFLRGCGLSDLDIEYAKLATPGLDPEQVAQITYEIHRLYSDQPIQFYSCFISYNSLDQAFAQRLHDDLQDNGVRCWFAPEDLKIGDEFRSAIGKQIRFRDKLLIILSDHSIRSEWVGDEVEKALAEEKAQKTLKLFPIRLDDAVMKAQDDWAEKIRLRRHIGDFTSDYPKAFQRLLRDLKSPGNADPEGR